MPQRAKRACTYPGCGVMTATGRCSKHKRTPWVKKVRDGFYDTPFWRKLRKQVISEEPICRICGVKPSKVAGHIIARRDGGADVRSNLRGECWDCSNRNTRREQLARLKKEDGVKLKTLRPGVTIVED